MTSGKNSGTGTISAPQAHSLTRSSRDYQRSPGKIFNGNMGGAGPQALLAASN